MNTALVTKVKGLDENILANFAQLTLCKDLQSKLKYNTEMLQNDGTFLRKVTILYLFYR